MSESSALSAILQELVAIPSTSVDQVLSILDDIIGLAILSPETQEYCRIEVSPLLRVFSEEIIAAIRSQGDIATTQVISKTLWALCRICRREMDKTTASQQNLAEVGPHCDVIVQTILANIQYADIVFPGCWLIMVLASDSTERQCELIAQGASTVIVSALQIHGLTNPEIAEFACRCTRNTSIEYETSLKLIEDGVADALFQVLHHYRGAEGAEFINEDVCEAVLWAVVNISTEGPLATQLGSAGLCGEIVETTKLLIANENGVEACLMALRNLSTSDAENTANFVSTEVLQVLINIATSHHTLSERICELILWNYAHFSEVFLVLQKQRQQDAEQHAQIVYAIAQSIVEINFAMREKLGNHYHAFGPIAEATLWAVRKFSRSSEESVCRAFCAVGIVDVIVQHMKSYVDREGMVEVSCTALLNIIDKNWSCVPGESTASSSSSKYEIISTILESILQHRENVEVTAVGFKLLRAAHEVIASLGDATLSTAIAGAALSAIYQHRCDPDVFEASCNYLLKMKVISEANRAQLIAEELVDGELEICKPPRGNFEQMLKKWGIDVLAADYCIDITPVAAQAGALGASEAGIASGGGAAAESDEPIMQTINLRQLMASLQQQQQEEAGETGAEERESTEDA